MGHKNIADLWSGVVQPDNLEDSFSGQRRIVSGANIPPALERRPHYNPIGTYQPKEKIYLTPAEKGLVKTSHLSAPVKPAEGQEFSLLDIIGIPKMSYLRPIGEDFGEAVSVKLVPLPELTNANLDQLLLWKRECHGGVYPNNVCTDAVVILSEDRKWLQTGYSWADIGHILAAGTHGVEKPFEKISQYIASRKPPLTPEYLRQLCASTTAHNGNKPFSYDAALWVKEGETWIPSLYSLKEINNIIRKSPDTFKADGVAMFRRMNGFPARGRSDINYSYNNSFPEKSAQNT